MLKYAIIIIFVKKMKYTQKEKKNNTFLKL